VVAPSVHVPYREFVDRSAKHDVIIKAIPGVEPRLQRLLAELTMMRLFDDFQEAIAGIALRLACGRPYGDGVMPVLLTSPARSTAGARTLFETHNRRKHQYCKWSKASYIRETTREVLDERDRFYTACLKQSLAISEMQAVRNRIAHRNAKSRKAFDVVLRRHYGASVNAVTPGLFLISPRFTNTQLERYLTTCRVLTKECSGS